MEFELPTTKNEMYNTLYSIFNYYRVKHNDFNIEEFKALELKNLSFNELSDDELREKASVLLAPSKQREIDKGLQSLDTQIEEYKRKILTLESKKDSETSQIQANFEEEKKKIQKKASENGVYASQVFLDEIKALNKEKTERLLVANSDYIEMLAYYNSVISSLEKEKSELSEKYEALYLLEEEAKISELKDEQFKIAREVAKYNNSISEKLQRYNNTLLQSRANLELKFLSIQAADLSKDQLVKLGYYKDVIDCVTAYYDTLEPKSAYNEFLNDTELITYLDSYYEQMLIMYRQKALATDS